ncbi:MAG: TfoX/Sxy family protein [Anaerolineae bacterium]|nr:TfoX/Sxy family protein [Anaerolineae bacterium]
MTVPENIRRWEYALTAALAELQFPAALEVRLMFGGAGFYVDGRIFAAWFGRGSVALKLSEDEGQALIASGGRASEGARLYIELPETALNDPAQLSVWVGKSVRYVRSLPSKRRSSKNKTKAQAESS